MTSLLLIPFFIFINFFFLVHSFYNPIARKDSGVFCDVFSLSAFVYVGPLTQDLLQVLMIILF